MSNKKLIKSTSIIGSAISASRVMGFLRDILFARFFGTGIFAQAFVVAYRLPNMLRDLIGEGATDAAIVPVLSEYKHTRTDDEYWQATRSILSILLVLLFIVTIAGIVFAPLIVRLIAPGFLQTPELYTTTVVLTRALFPFVFFLGLVAYSKGVLNSLHYFTTPALASVVLNITIIISLVALRSKLGINCMVVGVLVGGLLQVAIQVPPLLRSGFSLRGSWSFMHSVNRRIGKLLLPRILGTAVYQLSILVDTILASLAWIVGSGAPAALYFSNRLVQLPLAVFGISLATAALPKMSKEVAQKDTDTFKRTISFSLRTVLTIMIPASAGLMILARPIVSILFQRGEFTAYSTDITVSALFFYSVGLFAYAGIKILVSGYYSMGDTRTPVKTASFALIVNVILNLILMWPLKIGGLALATSAAAVSNFIILYVLLSRRIGDIGTSKLISSFSRILLAALVMSFVTYLASNILFTSGETSGIRSFVYLLAVISASSVTYILAAYLLKVEAVTKMVQAVKKRR